MITLESDRLRVQLHEPDDGFYQGTRFDRSGIFASALLDGVEMAGPWFESYSPAMHDAVQGPAEEFSVIGFNRAAPGDLFLKPGVGLLRRPDVAPYDRFRLYEVADPGIWTLEQGSGSVNFTQQVQGWYRYRKEIALKGSTGIVIGHRLEAEVHRLEGNMYNHNFWTFGHMDVGPERCIDFPFCPEGHWRAQYESVALTEAGIRFFRPLQKGESVFMGDLQAHQQNGAPYEMTVKEGDLSVNIKGSLPLIYIVFWSNHRIACVEPYVALSVERGQAMEWSIDYQLNKL